MDKVTEITRLFYEEHLRPTDIAKELDVAKSYVTKVIQKDERYIQEKENRIMQSKEKHKASKRLYINKKREQNRHDYEVLIRKINADNAKMSTHTKLTDENFAKWNSGMYEYDKGSSDLVLRKNIITGFDVCKRISNIVHPDCIKQKSFI